MSNNRCEPISQLSIRAKSLWAKASNDSESEEWLPLIIHMSDTSGIARLLWRQWLPYSLKEIIVNGIKNDNNILNFEFAEDLLVFLAAAHDLGKAIPAFQGKQINSNLNSNQDFATRVISSGLKIRDDLSNPRRIHHSLASEMILKRNGFNDSLGVVLGGHHGKPPSYDDIENFSSYSGNTGFKDKDWVSVQDELLLFDINLSNTHLDIIRNTSISVPTQFILTGIIIMSDWIASDEIIFPYISEDCVIDTIEPMQRVKNAWASLELPSRWDPDESWRTRDLYKERFGFTPRPFQDTVRSIVEDMSSPAIMIIEAPMGEGKTEAALVAAEIMAQKFGSGGIFFALPTQATADGLFPRIKGWIEKTIKYEDTHAIFLAHGKSMYNREYRELRSMKLNTDGLNDKNDGIIAHDWLQGRKKGILSEFVIGTVDQVLMCGLKQKHLCMRHLGLAGKVVIIDECHAYDAYMGSYMSKVLRWLGTYKVPVILLSATLPSERRKELIDSYTNKKIKENTSKWVSNISYPLITYSDGKCVKQDTSKISNRTSEVKIKLVNDDDVIEHIMTLSSGGGYVGIILNTVKRAQSFTKKLNEHHLDEVCLLHSRYINIDRTSKEAKVMGMLKEDREGPPHRTFIVGTQVIEQSLDLDFDLIVTDLCPMDLLIQRIGRLHRHNNTRPRLLKDPLCLVIDNGYGEFEKGSEHIYGRWHLMNARFLLPDRLCLPEDIPRLVQDAYNPRGISNIPENLRETYEKAMSDEIDELNKKCRKAETFQIRGPEDGLNPVIINWLENDKKDDELYAEAAVRDTNGSLEVIIIQKRNGRFYVLEWLDEFGGKEIPYDSMPNQELAFAIAGCKISLPNRFTASWNIQKTINEIENSNSQLPSCWQESSWLRGELFLIMDMNLSTELLGETLYYDRIYGLSEGRD
ncbi:MAG: CRISPR-associated helicase Cas3' [Candidatus Cloacimonetes bacterium]|nr:CRISPR-associated helicase Cas3' [Candidatus Cloacimonadota bacterium]